IALGSMPRSSSQRICASMAGRRASQGNTPSQMAAKPSTHRASLMPPGSRCHSLSGLSLVAVVVVALIGFSMRYVVEHDLEHQPRHEQAEDQIEGLPAEIER